MRGHGDALKYSLLRVNKTAPLNGNSNLVGSYEPAISSPAKITKFLTSVPPPHTISKILVLIVQRANNFIQLISRYPEDKMYSD